MAHGIGNVEQVLDKVRAARENGEEVPYHFIEVMACRGGCIAGGGQPRVMMPDQPKPRGITDDIRKKRAKGLFDEDLNAKTGFRIITNPLRRCMPSISARPVRKRHMSCCIRIMFRAGCIKNSDLAKKTTCKKLR